MSDCICHLVLPAALSGRESAVSCALCQRSLFQTTADNTVGDLAALNDKLVASNNAREQLQLENDMLQAEVAKVTSELEVLRSDHEIMAKKLIVEAEARAELLLEVWVVFFFSSHFGI